VKQNGQLARVVAEFLETAAKGMPSEKADLLLRSAHLLRESTGNRTATAEKRESQETKHEANMAPDSTLVQEKGVSVLDELLGLMLTEESAADKIAKTISERQRQMRENGVSACGARVELKFSRPDGQKVGIEMSEQFDIEELKKDLAAVLRLGFNCVAGYAC
jgi:hypothetical protein